VSRASREAVQGQLDALRAGDGVKALTYSSRRMRRWVGSPQQFVQRVQADWPELGKCRRAWYDPVWTDRAGSFTRADVLMEGENGRRSRGDFLLIHEGSTYRIVGVRPRPVREGKRS